MKKSMVFGIVQIAITNFRNGDKQPLVSSVGDALHALQPLGRSE
jgi:hypothetical protein